MKQTKKWLPILCLFALVSAPVLTLAQSVKDIFDENTPITYVGIDFRKAKLIGDAAANEDDIVARIFSAMNQLVVNEPKKFDLNKTLKREVATDLDVTETVNEKIDADELKSNSSGDFSRLNEADIDKLVKSYKSKTTKGIGLVFIMESMSKTAEKAAIWVTFYNMANGKVLLTEKMEAKPMGFGFRNFWVKTIAEVLEAIQKKKYKEWKGQYA